MSAKMTSFGDTGYPCFGTEARQSGSCVNPDSMTIMSYCNETNVKCTSSFLAPSPLQHALSVSCSS